MKQFLKKAGFTPLKPFASRKTKPSIKRFQQCVLFLFFAISIALNTSALNGEDSVTSDIFQQAAKLGRGVNFGNSLEAEKEGAWGMKLEERYFQLVDDAGFNTIRLPVRWSAHAETQPPYAIDPVFFKRVDWAIDQATKRGLNIVVNLHHYDDLFKDPTQHRPRFNAIWSQISERYKKKPPSVLFELCNEPHETTSDIWNEIAKEALGIVRATNPTRAIIIGGTDWNSFSKLPELKLPSEDQNIIATFHYYLPFHFTHQGADWVKESTPWLGTKWEGTEAEKTALRDDLDKADQWSKKYHRPVWVGEFGAYSKADLESRVRWTEFLARECEKRQMSWAYWEFGSGFGIYDRAKNKWRDPLLKALIPSLNAP